MRTYFSPKTEHRHSAISGTGLFAKEPIAKGEVVTVKSGDIVTTQEAMRIAAEVGDYYMQIDDDLYITPHTIEDIPVNACRINHSCEPNTGLVGHIAFVSLRDIDADEELTYDIAMTTAHPYQIECNCGSVKCRKIVTGEDWKRTELQDRYGKHFSWFIRQKIKALRGEAI